MKLIKKLRKRWQAWRFQKANPIVAERRGLLILAIIQGRGCTSNRPRLVNGRWQNV